MRVPDDDEESLGPGDRHVQPLIENILYTFIILTFYLYTFIILIYLPPSPYLLLKNDEKTTLYQPGLKGYFIKTENLKHLTYDILTDRFIAESMY